MRPACWRARPRDRGLSGNAALLTRCCLSKRLFRRDVETNTRDACATRNLSLPAALKQRVVAPPPANNVSAILPRLAIRRDYGDQSDRGKIVSSRKEAVALGFRRVRRFLPNHAPLT